MKRRVLAVDDDREWLGYYERLLARDYELEVFKDGVATMARMDEVVPDVLILDILLTGPTGFSLLNEMQSYADLAQVPVIVASSVGIKEDLSEYGVVRVFDKGTMRPEELLEEIRKQCRQTRLQADYSINGIKKQDGKS